MKIFISMCSMTLLGPGCYVSREDLAFVPKHSFSVTGKRHKMIRSARCQGSADIGDTVEIGKIFSIFIRVLHVRKGLAYSQFLSLVSNETSCLRSKANGKIMQL